MAAEAVMKITEAEEKGSEMIKSANERAKEIIRKAEMEANLKAKAITDEALKKKSEIISTAVKNAEKSCAGLVEQGRSDMEKILNPGAGLEGAVGLVFERIVNMNGDC